MYCPNCKIDTDGKFCPKCGTRLIGKQGSHEVATTSLKGPAATIMKIISSYFMSDDLAKIKEQIPKLSAFAKRIDADEVQHKYFVALAATEPEALVKYCKGAALSNNYWCHYWSFIALYQLGYMEKAENVLTDLNRFSHYPEDNISLLKVVRTLLNKGESEALTILNTVTGTYSEELSQFAKAIYLKLEPEKGKGMGANERDTAFYTNNIITSESYVKRELRKEREKAEAEAREKAEAEAKAKAAAEEAARKKAEADAIARKQINYTVVIMSIHNQLAAMMTTYAALGWKSSYSRKQLETLPVEAFVTDDKSKAISIYEKMNKDYINVNIIVKNGLGEIVEENV